MKRLLKYQMVITAMLLAIVLFLKGPRETEPLALGAIVGILNLAWTTLGWAGIFSAVGMKQQPVGRKKKVAWPASVIVFKYALLIGLAYWVTKQNQIFIKWFIAGFTLVVVETIVLSPLATRKKES